MKLKQLPFIKFAADGLTIESYWHVNVTDSWTLDNKTGQLHAVTLLKYMRDNTATAIFTNIIRDIYRHGLNQMGQLHGVSVGFLEEIARRAIG